MIKSITILFLLCGLVSAAQTPQQLQSDVKKLYVAFDEIDIDKLSVMLLSMDEPAKVYDKLDSYFLNDEQKFRYVYTNVKYNFGPIQTVDSKSYCVINFRNVVRITYFKPIDVASIQSMLKVKFNTESVIYEKARNSFIIVYNAKMIASQTGGIWQFAFADNTLPNDISGDVIRRILKIR